MRVSRNRRETEISYSFSSKLILILACALRYLELELTVISSASMLAVGLVNFLWSWGYLYVKLGICPGIFHSTLFESSMKNSEIRFKSSKVLEIGIIIGVLDMIYLYAFINTSSMQMILGYNALSYLCLCTDKSDYYISDFIGISFLLAGNLLITPIDWPADYFYGLICLLVMARVIIIKRLRRRFEECRSIWIVALVVQGAGLLSISGFYFEIGGIDHVLYGFLYSLLSYLMLEAASKEKPAGLVSIFSLQAYIYLSEAQIIPMIMSAAGLIFLQIGFQVCSLIPTRINLQISSSALNQPLI